MPPTIQLLHFFPPTTSTSPPRHHTDVLADLLDADVHAQCKERLQEAQEEFERYKLRAQSVLKSKCKVAANLTFPNIV